MAIVERPEPAKRESAERPIRIFLNEVPVAVSQGSPFGLSELAVGYLLSEGLIADRDSLVEVVEVPEEAAVYVASGERAEEGYVPLHRVTSAGCAQCGCAWEFERVRCVRCGTQNQSRLHYFNLEGDEAHRLATCDECGGYTRTVYEEDALAPFSFEVEDVVMAKLDLVAYQRAAADAAAEAQR